MKLQNYGNQAEGRLAVEPEAAACLFQVHCQGPTEAGLNRRSVELTSTTIDRHITSKTSKRKYF